MQFYISIKTLQDIEFFQFDFNRIVRQSKSRIIVKFKFKLVIKTIGNHFNFSLS